MDTPTERQHLAMADLHLLEGKQRVSDLVADIDRMTRQGDDTILAENLLTTFQQTFNLWEDHRVIILDAIARREKTAS